MDDNGKSDPYARVRLGSKKHVTKTKFKTLAPEWRQRFEFAVMDFGGRDPTVLQVDVWDRDLIGPDEFIGQVKVNLAELAVNVTDTRWWPLDTTVNPKRAKVVFVARLVPEIGPVTPHFIRRSPRSLPSSATCPTTDPKSA